MEGSINMKQYETKHYIFNYYSGSKAEEDILDIVALQEACYKHICNVLKVKLTLLHLKK